MEKRGTYEKLETALLNLQEKAGEKFGDSDSRVKGEIWKKFEKVRRFQRGENFEKKIAQKKADAIDAFATGNTTKYERLKEEINLMRERGGRKLNLVVSRRNFTVWKELDRELVGKVYNQLNASPDSINTNGERKADSFNWNIVALPKVKPGGSGSFGSFFEIPDSLSKASSLNQNFGIKVGEIGENEAKALKIVGEAGLGPKLIASQRLKSAHEELAGINYYYGRMAMSVVEGEVFYKYRSKATTATQEDKVNDIYWEARANLHKLGVAHRDAHEGNILVDSKGKGRFVDFGQAHVSHKYALAEALGGVTGSDHQVHEDSQIGKNYSKIEKNYYAVEKMMSQDGFSRRQINEFKDAGTVSSLSSEWNSMTKEQAKKYIDMLYDGV